MCSFLLTTKELPNIDALNRKLKRRGPDNTSVSKVSDLNIVHNLLHITGEKTTQPFIKDNSCMVYNGEIYNYCNSYFSDGPYLFNQLCKDMNLKEIIGEYSGVFINKDSLFLFTDLFNTKPMFYSLENEEIGISSYYSVLQDLGFNNINKIANNSILNLKTNKAERIYSLNVEQDIDNFDLWEKSFLECLDVLIPKDRCFMGISSGYDSGAIALGCKILNKNIQYFCIPKNESKNILDERNKYLGKIDFIDTNDCIINKHHNLIDIFGDNYIFNKDYYNYKNDPASIGLSIICEEAKKHSRNILISGAGCDEIMSDYGMHGRCVQNNSTLNGIFPINLDEIFPWNNFFNGSQEKYLYKEESVCGVHGVEARYPFLNINVVQNFLNIKPELKNKNYKSPIHNFFKKHKFPFEENIKRGFNI